MSSARESSTFSGRVSRPERGTHGSKEALNGCARGIAPVFPVADVAATIRWYRKVLDFRATVAPEKESFEWVSQWRDGMQIMPQRVPDDRPRGAANRSLCSQAFELRSLPAADPSR